MGQFKILTPHETKQLQPIDPSILQKIVYEHPEEPLEYLNQLLPNDQHHQTEYWFPTPENPGDEATHTPIQKRILQEFRDLKKLEQINPNNSDRRTKTIPQ